MLEPLLDSFECIDLRRFNRINTEIPADIVWEKQKAKGKCLIQDFSERFVRIEMAGEDNGLQPSLEESSNVVLRINLSSEGQPLYLQGKVYRKRKETLIISLENLMENGRFKVIDELDELFIKATMLEHPKTKRH